MIGKKKVEISITNEGKINKKNEKSKKMNELA